jgi:ATP synthase protein I
MTYVDALSRGARRVVLAQAAATLAIAAGFGVGAGWREASAALYGGAVTIAITAWLAWRLRRVRAQTGAGAGIAMIYSSTLVRYLTVVVLIGAGLAVLKLEPLPLLIAFAVSQFGYLAAWARHGTH